jgi:hypothetical protein
MIKKRRLRRQWKKCQYYDDLLSIFDDRASAKAHCTSDDLDDMEPMDTKEDTDADITNHCQNNQREVNMLRRMQQLVKLVKPVPLHRWVYKILATVVLTMSAQ